MISPTKQGIRNDSSGNGYYGASRGTRKHKGMDFLCDVGQKIIAPLDMHIDRISHPYAYDQEYTGIAWSTEWCSGRLWYFIPYTTVIAGEVKQGQRIGVAQDISKKYGEPMKPHLHLQINNVDPAMVMKLHKICTGLEKGFR